MVWRIGPDSETPSAAVGFFGIDVGHASNPKFLRPTLTTIPNEEKLMRKAGLTLGCVLSPLFGPLLQENGTGRGTEEPMVVYNQAPVRCHLCRGYLSSLVEFVEMGKRWRCPLCLNQNEVPETFFCQLGQDGRRLDTHQRPELCRATVEYDVEHLAEYASISRRGTPNYPSRPLPHLFVIDISFAATQSFLPDLLHGIREALVALTTSSPTCPVAFLLYARQLYFCDVHHPRMPLYSVADITSPFVPLPFDQRCWLSLEHDWEKIDRFLSMVPQIAADSREDGCSFGAAVEVILQLLASQPGARVFLTAHRFPSGGIGSTPTPRDCRKLYTKPLVKGAKELMHPLENTEWSKWAQQGAENQISFDLLFFPTVPYSELVTLSLLPHKTGGELFFLDDYRPGPEGTRMLCTVLRERCTEHVGYGAIVRVRCSPGLQVRRYRGHFYPKTATDMDVAGLTSRSTFYVEMGFEEKLEKNKYAYVQMATLYTTREGRRRVRVCNYPLLVSAVPADWFATADLEAFFYHVATLGAEEAVSNGVDMGAVQLTKQMVNVCLGYFKHGPPRNENRSSEFVLHFPRSLRLLAVYIMALRKSPLFIADNSVPMDKRIELMYRLLTKPLPELLLSTYPDIFALDALVSNSAYGRISESNLSLGADSTQHSILSTHSQLQGGTIELPPRRSANFESILHSGVYLLCDEPSRIVYLWIGREVPAEVSLSLFGVEDAQEVCRPTSEKHSAIDSQDPSVRASHPSKAFEAWATRFSEGVANTIEFLRSRYGRYRRLIVLHDGEAGEEEFFLKMVEEKSIFGSSYSQYLWELKGAMQKAAAL